MDKKSILEYQQFQNVLWVMFIFASLLILAFMVVNQVYHYRHDYKKYNQLIRERDTMMVEYGQLLIEQQAFGATSQIGTRAVTQLGMFSPPISKTVILAPNINQQHNISINNTR